MKNSVSAPVLRNSPYNQSLATTSHKPRSTVWQPPPGGHNEPDLPVFEGPGPGQYQPKEQYACLSTKPRVLACRFGGEDRFKYLAPMRPLEGTSSGLLGGGVAPQSSASPGPAYLPSYASVHRTPRVSSFSVQRRDTSGVEAAARISGPGPGLYNPTDKAVSTKRNLLAGGAFLADDRQKYFAELDPSSLLPSVSQSPGPLYNPSDAITQPRVLTVSFGGRGPGKRRPVPSLKQPMPGPGAYTPIAQNAALSTKPTVLYTQFGVEARASKGMMDSSACFHGNVPVDMTHASTLNLSPGPSYNPSIAPVKKKYRTPIIGTAKRFARIPIIVK